MAGQLYLSIFVLAQPPERIISLSPSVTEILHGVGAFSRVVAVSSYCDYPPKAKLLPKVGGWTNVNLEQVVALQPDVVMMIDDQAPLIRNQLEMLGIETMVVRGQSLQDVYETIREIGSFVGNSKEAVQLITDTHERLDLVAQAVNGARRPRVLCVVDRLPGTLRDMYVATEGSFLTNLIRVAGGEPITPTSTHQYAKISMEAVVALDPEVILDMVQAVAAPVTLVSRSTETIEDPLAVWQTILAVTAVRDRRVYLLRDKKWIHPSQFIAQAAEEIARRIHPGRFSEEEQ